MKNLKIPITKTKLTDSSDEALFSLLQDGNEIVSTLAMEQILQSRHFDKLMQKYQDSNDAVTRKRVHQMSNINKRRQLLQNFLEKMQNSKLKLWKGLQLLDYLYDPRSSADYLNQMSKDLLAGIKSLHCNADDIAFYLREKDFQVTSQSWLDISNYLLGDVLETQLGSAVLLCVIARHLGSYRGWQSEICLHSGRFCLIDAAGNLVDPSKEWLISRDMPREQCHVCNEREVLHIILSQLFSIAIINWEPWDVYLFAKIITSISKLETSILPYPLGDYLHPEKEKLSFQKKA